MRISSKLHGSKLHGSKLHGSKLHGSKLHGSNFALFACSEGSESTAREAAKGTAYPKSHG